MAGFLFHQCVDIVGRATGRASGLQKQTLNAQVHL